MATRTRRLSCNGHTNGLVYSGLLLSFSFCTIQGAQHGIKQCTTQVQTPVCGLQPCFSSLIFTPVRFEIYKFYRTHCVFIGCQWSYCLSFRKSQFSQQLVCRREVCEEYCVNKSSKLSCTSMAPHCILSAKRTRYPTVKCRKATKHTCPTKSIL